MPECVGSPSPWIWQEHDKAALDKKADVLITGDIGHHEGIDAVARDWQSLTQVTMASSIYLWKI